MIALRTISLICLITAGLVLPAAADELVVATFGGTFVDNSKKCHAAAFEKATGSSVKYVLGSSVQTMAKLRAAGARAEFDVAYMDSQIVKPRGCSRPSSPPRSAAGAISTTPRATRTATGCR